MAYLEFEKSVKVKEWSMNALHSHPHYEIYLLLSGERMFFLTDSLYNLKAGTLVVVPPYVMHKTEGGPFERFNINVTTDFLDAFQKATLDNTAKLHAFSLSGTKLNEIKKLVALMEKVDNMSKYSSNIKSALFGYFIFLVSDADGRTTIGEKINNSTSAPPVVLKTIKYLTENFDKKINLSTISKEFFLSKTSVCKQFKKATNCTVIDFLLNTRINKARYYLANTKKSATEIAYLCGFCSQNYFGLIFRRKVGMSPLQYRKHETQKS